MEGEEGKLFSDRAWAQQTQFRHLKGGAEGHRTHERSRCRQRNVDPRICSRVKSCTVVERALGVGRACHTERRGASPCVPGACAEAIDDAKPPAPAGRSGVHRSRRADGRRGRNLFRGGFTETVPVTVISDRAGLVMNPDAKVKMHGVQVGKVASIEELPNGQAAIHLAMDPSRLNSIPANVARRHRVVDGVRRQVRRIGPARRSRRRSRCTPARSLDAQHVTVEINTVFEQLTSVLSKIEPAKLNETLGATRHGVDGRGEKFGQMLSDLDAFLAKLEPSLPSAEPRHRRSRPACSTPTPTRRT